MLILLLVPSAGCSPDKSPEPCGPREPAFAIQVTVGGAELPSDMLIEVTYGGNQSESFQLSREGPSVENADVCCQTSGEPITGDLPRVTTCADIAKVGDAGPVTAIQCTLWTGGPATVDINASGYLPLDPAVTELDTRLQENEKCGVKTREYWLSLGRPDGGI